MLLEQERNYGLGMDALVTACSWNTNGIMVWAWMLSRDADYANPGVAAAVMRLSAYAETYGVFSPPPQHASESSPGFIRPILSMSYKNP